MSRNHPELLHMIQAGARARARQVAPRRPTYAEAIAMVARLEAFLAILSVREEAGPPQALLDAQALLARDRAIRV